MRNAVREGCLRCGVVANLHGRDKIHRLEEAQPFISLPAVYQCEAKRCAARALPRGHRKADGKLLPGSRDFAAFGFQNARELMEGYAGRRRLVYLESIRQAECHLYCCGPRGQAHR